jgi:hypothetical protein
LVGKFSAGPGWLVGKAAQQKKKSVQREIGQKNGEDITMINDCSIIT